MPTYLLLDRLIIITLLFEAALNKACCVGVARRRHRSSVKQKAQRFSNWLCVIQHLQNMAAKFYPGKLKQSIFLTNEKLFET